MAKKSPVPVKTDSRICFGIEWFATEADAKRRDKEVRKRGDTYNGGYFHGMACGRDPGFDHTDPTTGRKLYAVTRS